jgi:putative flippase GtrA
MKKSDILAILILGEITAVIAGFLLKKPLSQYQIAAWVLYVFIPLAALVINVAAKLISRKIIIVWQFAKYATVGVANTLVDFGVLNLLMWSSNIYRGEILILFNSISFSVAVIHSYAWNRLWAFKGSEKANIFSQFAQFLLITLIGLLINSAIVYMISTWVKPMFGMHIETWTNIAKVIATVVSLIWNFAGYKLIVFKKKNEQQSR